MIYTGDGDALDETSFNEVYFNGESVVDLKVNVLKDVNTSTIYGQYIGFCKIYNKMRKITRTRSNVQQQRFSAVLSWAISQSF